MRFVCLQCVLLMVVFISTISEICLLNLCQFLPFPILQIWQCIHQNRRLVILLLLFHSYKVIAIQGGSSIYLLSQNPLPNPELNEKFVQVELLQNHVYCLLPSIGSDLGSVTLYSSMPGFIKDFFFHIAIGKV